MNKKVIKKDDRSEVKLLTAKKCKSAKMSLTSAQRSGRNQAGCCGKNSI